MAALRAAGEAIDRVHARVPGWLRPGRTERQVAADISDAIIEEGHAGSTSRSSRPGRTRPARTTTAADRVLQPGDAVVVDIGGTMPSGYCSDCTRTYVIGAPPEEFAAYYRVLQDAQEAACAAVRPGVSRRGRRRRRARADHRGRLRRVLRAPDRPRHRPGEPRGSLHRVRQRRAAAAGHRLLHRARHLPGPARRQDRGHRGLHRAGLRAAQQRHPRSRRGSGPVRAVERERRDEDDQGAVRAGRELADAELRPGPTRPSGTARSRARCSGCSGRTGLLAPALPGAARRRRPALRDLPAGRGGTGGGVAGRRARASACTR